MTNEHTSLEKYTSHTLFPKRVAKGLTPVMYKRWVGDGTDCHILTPSSSAGLLNYGSWGPKPSVWNWFSLWHLIANWNCNSNWTDSNWLPPRTPTELKPSVAPGYIIVWHPPASCGRTHLHRIQPVHRSRWYSGIFDRMHLFLDWRLGWGSICYSSRAKAPTTKRKIRMTSLVIMAEIQEELVELLTTFVHPNSTTQKSAPTLKQTTIKSKP